MRVKAGVTTRHRKKKYFRQAKGYFADRGTRWRQVRQQVERSWRFSYTSRKDNKGNFRALWIQRINAASRMGGMSYSRFMSGLHLAGVRLDRKVLAQMAMTDPQAFEYILSVARESNPSQSQESISAAKSTRPASAEVVASSPAA